MTQEAASPEPPMWAAVGALQAGDSVLDVFEDAFRHHFCCAECALRWLGPRIARVIREEASAYLPAIVPDVAADVTPDDVDDDSGWTGDDSHAIGEPLRRLDRWVEGVVPNIDSHP